MCFILGGKKKEEIKMCFQFKFVILARTMSEAHALLPLCYKSYKMSCYGFPVLLQDQPYMIHPKKQKIIHDIVWSC